MTRPTIGRALTAAAAVAVLAACSDSSDATDTTSAPTPQTAEPTIAAATSPPPPVTLPPPTTSTTTTTEAPPATEPETSLAEQIEADLNEGEQAFLEAGSDPASQAAQASVDEFFVGRAQENVRGFFASLIENGLRTRPNPDVASRIEVLDVVEQNDDSALIRLCRIDAAVVMIPATDESPEVIVNDEIIRYVNETNIDFSTGRWRLGGGKTLDETTGATTCDGF